MLHLYNAALAPARWALPAWVGWRARDAPARREWAERRARILPAPLPGCLWLHGSSVGEVALLGAWVSALRRRGRTALAGSCFTRTGRARLDRTDGLDRRFFLPLDFRGNATRIVRALRPAGLALIETELWPNLLREAQDEGVPIAILNARLAPERMTRYRALRGLYRPALRAARVVCCQSEADRDRFLEIGADPSRTFVDGNAKVDRPAPLTDRDGARRRLGSAPDTPWFVAGSTAEGEDEAVLGAWRAARAVEPRLRLLIAPRHLERLDSVEAICREAGLVPRRASRIPAGRTVPSPVVLLDSHGELEALYAAADVAFVGGSLAPVGGHNPLEPAAHGVPVLFGPHTHHTGGLAEGLVTAGGGRRVADARALVDALVDWLRAPAEAAAAGRRGRRWLDTQRGALDRQLDRWLETVREAP